MDRADQLDAHAFDRRRLVAAFVQGSPDGQEAEPPRPGRALAASVALVVLLFVGAGIWGVLSPRASIDWSKPGLVANADTGVLYVIVDDDPVSGEPRVRPATNVTSARLAVGAGITPQVVSADLIAAGRQGPPIGLVDAPTAVPEPAGLVADGWTACTGSALGLRVAVSAELTVTRADDVAMLISAGDGLWLLRSAPSLDGGAESAYRYRIPARAGTDLHDALQVPFPDHAVEAPEEWLALVPAGGALDAEGLGLAAPGAASQLEGLAPDARVGDWFELRGSRYVVTESGAARLDDFAAAVLAVTDLDGHRSREVVVEDPAQLQFAAAPWQASRWPDALAGGGSPGPVDQVCVVRTAGGVGLALDPTTRASAEAVAAGSVDHSVQPGRGALVSGDADPEGAAYLIDDRGLRHVLTTEGAERLGYADMAPVVVPQPWLELFEEGVELSPDAVLCPPGARYDHCP